MSSRLRMYRMGWRDGYMRMNRPRTVPRRYRQEYLRGFCRGAVSAVKDGLNPPGRLM